MITLITLLFRDSLFGNLARSLSLCFKVSYLRGDARLLTAYGKPARHLDPERYLQLTFHCTITDLTFGHYYSMLSRLASSTGRYLHRFMDVDLMVSTLDVAMLRVKVRMPDLAILSGYSLTRNAAGLGCVGPDLGVIVLSTFSLPPCLCIRRWLLG